MHSQNKYNIEETKEPFCGACAAIPLAFAGAGVSAYGMSSKGSNKRMKKILIWSGVVSVIVTIIIAYIFLKNCSDCK